MKNYTKAIKFAFIVLFLGTITLNASAQQDTVLNFDGVNDYVTIPYNSTLTPEILSFQMYVDPSSANAGNTQAIFTNGGADASGNYHGFGLYILSDQWTVYYGLADGTLHSFSAPGTVAYDTWTNVAATYNGNTLIIYVNGVNVASLAVTGITTNISPLPMILGAGEGTPPTMYYFEGDLDDFSIWNVITTPAGIISHMDHELTGSEAGLLAFYNFNEGIPNGDNTTPPVNTLTDRTANLQNGTLINFALTGNFSNWINPTQALPINLTNFSGTKKAGGNLLQWSTASEQNSSYFEIQRGVNGTNFNDIAQVSAAGNSSTTKNYQYLDDQISSSVPIYYYRLKMVDINGSTKYSTIIFIKNSSDGLATVYPNPVINQFSINLGDNSLINTQAVLSDLNGKVLQRITLNQTSTQVDISSYPTGVYILKLTNGNSVKIIKE